MSIINKLGTFTAAVSVAALMVAGAADAKDFKIAVGDSAGSPQEATGKFFVEALEEKSGGAHTATLFLNGQLGSEQDTVNEAAIGTLDMSLLAINNVTPFSPSVGVFTLPYVILSLEDAETLTQLPTLGRGQGDIARLAPGVTFNGGTGEAEISGANSGANTWLINGADSRFDNIRSQPGNAIIEDSIAETTVMTAAISAEYGQFTGCPKINGITSR